MSCRDHQLQLIVNYHLFAESIRVERVDDIAGDEREKG